MEKKILNEKESLAIITSMIQKAKANLGSSMASSILLFWGYTTIIISILIIILNVFNIWSQYSLLWLAIPLICYPRTIYLSVQRKNYTPSYLDKNLNYISTLYIFVCTSVAFATTYSSFPVFFIEGLLISMWAVSIGIMIKYNKIIFGGIASIILSHAFLFFSEITYIIVIFILIVIMAIIIPGHLLTMSLSKKNEYV